VTIVYWSKKILYNKLKLTSEHGMPFGIVPELLFEKKGLIPALQQLILPLM
jgi:hypothetical protein